MSTDLTNVIGQFDLEPLLSVIFSGLKSWICITDQHGVISYSNGKGADFLKLNLSEIIGRNLLEFVTNASYTSIEQMALVFTINTRPFPVAFVRFDKKIPVIFDIRVQEVFGIGGELNYLVIVDEVLTVDSRLEDRARSTARRAFETVRQLVEVQDAGTGCHHSRVAQISRELCKCLGLTLEIQKTVAQAALLHDLGKLGNEGVYQKSGPLTAEEKRIIKTHPGIGYRLLRVLCGSVSLVPQIVLDHHEKLDGSGYPSGLTGDKLPITSRILQVADIWAAMREPRPYRVEPFPPEVVRAEIVSQRGSKLDDEVVSCFTYMYDHRAECLFPN
jgi:HD-GYP domain-containing protein (c-di-GMP phosphodiesterase class II)